METNIKCSEEEFNKHLMILNELNESHDLNKQNNHLTDELYLQMLIEMVNALDALKNNDFFIFNFKNNQVIYLCFNILTHQISGFYFFVFIKKKIVNYSVLQILEILIKSNPKFKVF